MKPLVHRINTSWGGVPKHPREKAFFTKNGLEGDKQNDTKHHGGPLQAVCLFSLENIAYLIERGFKGLSPGALAENLTTKNLDYKNIRTGNVYQIGEQVKIEITRPRTPCEKIEIYGAGIEAAMFDREVKSGNPSSPLWGRSGFYASVLEEGTVHQHDLIKRI